MQFSLTLDLPNRITKDSLECTQSHTHFLLYCYSLDLGGAGYGTPQTERCREQEMEAVCFPHPSASWLKLWDGELTEAISYGRRQEALLDTSTVLCNKVGYHLILERVTSV